MTNEDKKAQEVLAEILIQNKSDLYVASYTGAKIFKSHAIAKLIFTNIKGGKIPGVGVCEGCRIKELHTIAASEVATLRTKLREQEV